MLVTVVSAGRRKPRPAADLRPLLRPYEELRPLAVDRERTVTFTISGDLKIDGEFFDPDRIDRQVQLGALEEWTVVNASPLVSPFHIHVNPFQLTHVDGAPVEVECYQDTMPIDARGSITFRTRFLDFTGRSLFHCHIATHSGIGMAAVFGIGGPDGQPAGDGGGAHRALSPLHGSFRSVGPRRRPGRCPRSAPPMLRWSTSRAWVDHP